jgi:alanyl-tRNA synthetase
MGTERLYYSDSYLAEFTARVTDTQPGKQPGEREVVLDRTAFYPEGGGQPSDLGTLAGAPVLGVVEREGEAFHRVRGDLPGGEVTGRIDWPRRFDHMQQHTGQHILSQAFSRLLRADTVSFHMGADTSSIDIAIPSLSPEQVETAEDFANRVVFENRPVRVHMVAPSELARFELRKGTERVDQIRVVEVEEFDSIPCGGTHCRSTGEVGLIKVTRWERRSGNSRVEFLCGGRALRDYRLKNEVVVSLAAGLSVRDVEVRESVDRLAGEASESRRLAEQLRNRLLDYQARELALAALPVGRAMVVATALQGSGAEELRHLAARLVAEPSRVALLASAADRCYVAFARSENLDFDASILFRKAVAPHGGRGGGRPHLAQGGAPDPGVARPILDDALRELSSLL